MKGYLGLILSLFLAACGARAAVPTAGTPIASQPAATPSPTQLPVAAMVNGQPILLDEVEAEAARLEEAQAAIGIQVASSSETRQTVLEMLIERELLSQAALRAGMTPEQDPFQRIEALTQEMGGPDAMNAWLAAQQHTLDTFRSSLEKETLAAQMIEQIVSAVPNPNEQAHARHILVGDLELAQSLRQRLLAGADFASLAFEFSLDLSTRLDGGDLGWFPRGYLTMPEVEQAAFSLSLDEVSQPIQSALGFHLIQVLERGEHELMPDAHRRLRQLELERWLAEERDLADIQILITF
jgi:peptidyl-prolyl cis-trans isomerase C